MTTYALRLENGTDTAARVRMGDLLGLPVGTTPLTTTSALRADGGGVVSVNAGTMNVSVTPFMAWIRGGISTVQGGYPFVADAVTVLTLSTGHATLSRTDVIAGVVRDSAFDASGQLLALVTVISGTPGAGVPALPTNAVALREITVPATATSLVAGNLSTDRRVFLERSPRTLDYATGSAVVQSGDGGPKSIPGMLRVVQVPSTTAVVWITLELDWSTAAGSTIGYFRPLVDGVSVSPDMVLNMVAGRYAVTKTWRVTGLTAGSRTVTASVSWGAGALLEVVLNTSALIVEVRAS